jgi:hypothetical protein
LQEGQGLTFIQGLAGPETPWISGQRQNSVIPIKKFYFTACPIAIHHNPFQVFENRIGMK